jgi:hypothetical protein
MNDMDARGSTWSAREVAATVASYFDMLALELAGQQYNKAASRRELLQKLDRRSSGAAEFKHCNISAALEELGIPYIRGYKPRRNFQRELLFAEILIQLSTRTGFDSLALDAVERPASLPLQLDFDNLVTEAPRVPGTVAADYQPPSAVKRDYLAIEARNRALGLAGELCVLQYEKWRLQSVGRDDLAQRIEHVADTRGDNEGYDILSFDQKGIERFLEVKTTAYGEQAPFFISANEERFSREHDVSYRIARLYAFRDKPKLFWLNGPVKRNCDLDPTTYRAWLKER